MRTCVARTPIRTSMRNIELKAVCRQPDEAGERARAHGASDRGRMLQVDTYFRVGRGRLKLREIFPRGTAPGAAHRPWTDPDAVHPPRTAPEAGEDGAAGEGQAGDGRAARGIPDQAELIYYEREDLRGPKESEYHVMPVAGRDARALRSSLERAIGIRAIVRKERHLFIWRQSRIHIDRVDGLGFFLEIETIVEGRTDEEARSEHEEVRRILAIADEDLIEGSYVDLVIEDRR